MADEKPDDIVGHKTFHDGEGFSHEPLTRAEADAILAACDAQKDRRTALYPTPEEAVRGMCDAWQRLKELGWKEARYAPPDGRIKKTCEVGSSGIHDAYCERKSGTVGLEGSPDKWWWHPADGDLWPHNPALYFPDEQETREWEERMAKARAMREERETLREGNAHG